MKPSLIALAVGCILAAVVAGCSRSSAPAGTEAATERSAEPESSVRHGTNGEILVTLTPAKLKAMQLQTASLSTSELKPERKGYGRVLDASGLAQALADLTTAQANAQLTQAEMKRLRTLAEQNNASQRALQAAEAAAARDEIQVEAARLRLVSGWGKALAERADLAALVRALSARESALVEIDLPAGEAMTAAPTAARFAGLSPTATVESAQFLGPAPMVDPQMQGSGYLFLAATNVGWLAPGAAVIGYLQLPGEAQAGLLLPQGALVQYNGAYWVYRQTGEATFERVEVVLGRSLADGWFLPKGLGALDKVVVVGAASLLSEELKEQIGE